MYTYSSEIKVITAMDFENVFAIKLTKLSLSQVLKKGNIRKLNTFIYTFNSRKKVIDVLKFQMLRRDQALN